MMNKLATDIQIAPSGGFRGIGTLGDPNNTSNGTGPLGLFRNLISTVIGLMTLIAIIWFIFLLVSGAISYMSSGGDKNAVESAKKRISNALIGLVIVVISIFIIKLLGYLLGFQDILDFNAMFITLSTRMNP